MTQTANLGLPYIAADQSQPHVTHNAALDGLDAALGPVVGAWSFVRLETIEVTLDLATDTTAAALIPDRAIVLGVTSEVVADITGATGYAVGFAGGSEFGDALDPAAGASNVGAVGPVAVYADTDVTVTGASGAITGGTLRLAAAVIRLGLVA